LINWTRRYRYIKLRGQKQSAIAPAAGVSMLTSHVDSRTKSSGEDEEQMSQESVQVLPSSFIPEEKLLAISCAQLRCASSAFGAGCGLFQT
jgi:hypothetical protein